MSIAEHHRSTFTTFATFAAAAAFHPPHRHYPPPRARRAHSSPSPPPPRHPHHPPFSTPSGLASAKLAQFADRAEVRNVDACEPFAPPGALLPSGDSARSVVLFYVLDLLSEVRAGGRSEEGGWAQTGLARRGRN